MQGTICHFEMPGLLPEKQLFALNSRLGTLALLANDPKVAHPLLITEQQFNRREMSVLVPLLRLYPHYCPYEFLLANFNCGNTDQKTVERFHTRLQEAHFAGVWDSEMRPVRNVLSRTRFKLREFGIEVTSLIELGYLLVHLPMRRKQKKT